MSKITDGLSILGGADLEVLKKAKSERGTFVGLGLVMLGTASVAALSMAFALDNAVLVKIDPETGGPDTDQPTMNLVISILLGVIWGALILILDRALIKTMQGVAGPKALIYAIPRFVLAVIIGVVVSTPITLQIFHSEITAQVKTDQDYDINQMQQEAEDSDVARNLAAIREQITAQEEIANGNVPGLSSPALDAAQKKLDDAVAAESKAQAARDDAYLNMICEEEGAGALPDCQGRASDEPGRGVRYARRLDEYNTAYRQLQDAMAAVQTATAERDQAQNIANQENATKVAENELQANILLCGEAKADNGKPVDPQQPDPACQGGLRARAAQMQATLRAMENGDVVRERAGLLAQIVALGKISAKDGEAATAHLFVALLFMVIELLPVIIKTFIAVRGVTQYDRIAQKLQDDEFDGVTTDTEERQKQRDRETQKKEAIRNDMLTKEIDLGKEANKHVAGEMETILEKALKDWSAKVQTTLASNPATPGQNQPKSSKPNNPYGLPDGSKI